MDQATTNSFDEQTTVLESLQALLMDEQQVLKDNDYNRLSDITELKRLLLGKLEYLSETAVMDDAAGVPNDKREKRSALLEQCAELNIRNGIEINKNYAFVQGILNRVVGRDSTANTYSEHGYAIDDSVGRLNTTV